MKKLLFVVGMMMLCIPIQSKLYAQANVKKPKIAVMNFVNATGRMDYDYLQQSIPENIITTFSRSPNVIIIERSILASIISELELAQSGIVDESTAAKVGNALGADGVITGSCTMFGDQLRMNARLIDVQTIQVEFSKQVSGTDAETLIDELAAQLLMQITPDAAEKARLLDERERKIKSLESQMKSPLLAGAGGFILPVLGHAYVGGTFNIIRGLAYTTGPVFVVLGISLNIDEPGEHSPPILIGLGICLVSSIDAIVTVSNRNKKIRDRGLKIGFEPGADRKSAYLALTYRF